MRNVRIDSISISNFKNVEYGTVSFTNKDNYKASILGLYGQNGSGKTALIDSINILKYALSGRKIPNKFSNLINVNSDNSKFEFVFKMTDNTDIVYLTYEFLLKRETNIDLDVESNKYYPVIDEEKLYYSRVVDDVSVLARQSLIDTTIGSSFGPKPKYEMLVDNTDETDIIVEKKMAYKTGKSFVFSKEFLKIISNNCKNDLALEVFNTIVNYAQRNLFVLSNQDSALVSFDALPLFFRLEEEERGFAGTIAISIDNVGTIRQQDFDIVNKVINNMNIVLPQLVPNLKICMKKIGEDILADGTPTCKVQLFSEKNNQLIPLKYESDGIKKIVEMLQLLIVVYNNPSVSVAIDELDSGVFEYLLGELLRIISDNGKGQLIFTSHNLRPLETIDKSFIAFTTTNPKNRYIRFKKLKPTNNLRDYYYRDIVLGENQEEVVYDRTNNRHIAFAFKEAGEYNG